MTYRLFKTPNGIKQVPVRENEEFDDFDYNQQIPEEAKGVVKGGEEALFVEQTRNQKRNLKESMTGQVAFQQEALQYNNLQIVNFQVGELSTGSAAYIYETYNTATAVGSSLNETIMFSGIASGDNNDALYYNIVYMNIRLNNYGRAPFLFQPSYVEFYPMQKIAGGSSAGGKIPTQISNTSYDSATTITSGGTEFGVQSFGADVYNEQTLYNQTKDLKGIRCIGIALKRIMLNFESALDTAVPSLDVEIGIDMKSGGSSY